MCYDPQKRAIVSGQPDEQNKKKITQIDKMIAEIQAFEVRIT